MATVDHLTLPDELLNSLRQRAASSGISIEEQVLRDLSRVAREEDGNNELLTDIRKDRDAMKAKGVYLTDEDINRAKRWGRE